MSTIGKFGVFGLFVLAAMTVGCDKKVQLTFQNLTPESRDIQLSTPDGTEYIGTVPPAPAKIKHELKIKQDELPTNITWQAGDLSGTFPVNKDTPDKLWVDIGSGRGPRDKHTTVNETRKADETHIIEQGEVVK